MEEYNLEVPLTGEVRFAVSASDEDDAKTSATAFLKNTSMESLHGCLHEIKYKIKRDGLKINSKGLYCFEFDFSGWMDIQVDATSEREAKTVAREICEGVDFVTLDRCVIKNFDLEWSNADVSLADF